MKQLGCALLLLGVPVAVFLGLLYFVILDTPDQSSLTEEVDVVVTDSEQDSRTNRGRGWALSYSYRIGGEWFAADDWLDRNYWRPGQPLVACVDPGEPTTHAIRTDPADECGSGTISGGTSQATPSSAPKR